MANWSLPTIEDLKTNIITYLKGRDDDSARMHDSRVTAATNVPDYSKRWNDTTKTIQNWLSSAWSNLILGIAGGGTGASTAAGARTNLDVYSKSEADAAFVTDLTNVSSYLSATLTLTNALTEYDGPSVSLTAGTWMITASAEGTNSGLASYLLNFTAKLYVGAAVVSQGSAIIEARLAGSSQPTAGVVPLSAIATVGATTTCKITGISTVAGTAMNAALRSYIHAVKIA